MEFPWKIFFSEKFFGRGLLSMGLLLKNFIKELLRVRPSRKDVLRRKGFSEQAKTFRTEPEVGQPGDRSPGRHLAWQQAAREENDHPGERDY